MVDLKQVFTQMVEGVKSKDERYKVMDHYHVYDNHLCIEYHLEKGKMFKITHEDGVILTGDQMTQDEAMILQTFSSDLPKLHADLKREIFFNMSAGGVNAGTGEATSYYSKS